MDKQENLTRRDFIEKSILGTAATLGAGAVLAACSDDKKSAKRTVPPSDRVTIAMVGMRGYGMKLSEAFSKVPGCDITHVCDVDTAVGAKGVEHIERLGQRKPAFVQDLRKLFEDKNIDAVALSIPHHWHALAAVWAMQAGKHVYLEKPVTHNIREGCSLTAAAAKYKRVVQSGTQLRSDTAMAKAAQYIQSGKLGQVNVVKCLAYKRRKSIGPAGSYSPPSTVDYDLWTGPAPLLPISRKRFHYDWHWFWEYGNGGLGNNGVHRVDLARWALNLKGLGDSVLSFGGRYGYEDAGVTPNTQMTFHRFGDTMVIQELRGLPTRRYLECANGVLFFGTEGHLHFEKGEARIFSPDGKYIRSLKADTEKETHQENFIRAVSAGDPKVLNGGLEEGIASAALCHVGSISQRVGRLAKESEVAASLEQLNNPETIHTLARTRAHLGYKNIHKQFTLGPLLQLDSKNETILNHVQAQSLMGRQYREPFVLPSPDKI
jgi:predicted dehydrogenase